MNNKAKVMITSVILVAICAACLCGCSPQPTITPPETLAPESTGFMFQPHVTIPHNNPNRDDYNQFSSEPPPTITYEMLNQVSAGMHIREIVDILGTGVDITSGVASGVYSLPDGRWVYVWYGTDFYCTSIMVETYGED